jgi:ubiquinone/menaquinone biosynthesis C-methylase UbiE
MINEEQWKKAQTAEAANWADSGRNAWRLLHELTEHSEVAKSLYVCLDGKKKLRALEVGVGPLGIGFLAVHVAPYVSKIVAIEPLPILGIDLDDKALENYARTLQSRVEVVNAKGEKIPFPDESFDVTCCINVIDHAHAPDKIHAEISRVTKVGGILIFGVNTLSFLGRVKWRLLRAKKPNAFLFVAHPYIYGWKQICKKFQAGEGWSTAWENRPSIFQRVAGNGTMSFWILERKR